MSKKLIFILSGFVMLFICFSGNRMFAYKQAALQRAMDAANKNFSRRYMFTDYLPRVRMSMLLGLPTPLHCAENYCWFLNCNTNELNNLLDGTFSDKDGTVDKIMMDDFMNLAAKVKEKLQQH